MGLSGFSLADSCIFSNSEMIRSRWSVFPHLEFSGLGLGHLWAELSFGVAPRGPGSSPGRLREVTHSEQLGPCSDSGGVQSGIVGQEAGSFFFLSFF